MIHTEKCFVLTCDNCNETYQNDHSGFSMYATESDVLEEADNDGWYTHTDDGKDYCPKCHSMNDNDELVIAPAPASIINK